MTAIHIKANGEKTEVEPQNGKFFLLEELQHFVGGYIEMLLTKDQQTMVINEDGKLKNLNVNQEATELIEGHVIVGDVLVCNWSAILM
jgi:hypothetical protein